MAQHNDTGRAGEEAALAHLLARGYVLLHRNWRPPSGPERSRLELDLVMQDGHEVVVVEVKTLSSGHSRRPEENVTPAKLSQLQEAAEAYCALEEVTGVVRFDVVGVVFGKKVEIQHHENIST